MAEKRQIGGTAYQNRRIEQVNVHAAYAHVRELPAEDSKLGFDSPLKVLTPTEAMFNGKRSGLSERQYLAAQIYSNAYEAQWAAMGGVMDFDRIRGSGQSNFSPTAMASDAANKIAAAHAAVRKKFQHEADTFIGILERVAGRGYTIEDCARAVYGVGQGERVSGARRTKISTILKAALDCLSDLWHGRQILSPKIRSVQLTADAKPTTINPGAFDPGRTVHASRHKIQEAEEVRARPRKAKAS